MMGPLDKLVAELPEEVQNMEVYVDDVSLQVLGEKRRVEGIAVRAARMLF